MKIKYLAVAVATLIGSSAMAQSAFVGAYGQLGIGYDQNSVASTNLTVNTIYNINNPGTDGGSFAGVVGVGYNFA
uniref:Outer membrane protein beta-barrel domain-containing protein n=1 Tax=Polynucleobacter necessarius subsp. necessarius (strain STIR1) TaxID=452638 RepID=B1XRY9_POLNS